MVVNAQAVRSETGFDKKGRFGIQAGTAILLAPIEDGMEDLARVGFHGGMSYEWFLKTPRHALGIAGDYRYNSYDFGNGWNNSYKVGMHTMFIAPQYSYMSTPYGKGSFIMDCSMGYAHYSEICNELDIKVNTSGFGANFSLGYAVALNERGEYVTFKASFFGSTVTYRGMESNISSANISVGFIL